MTFKMLLFSALVGFLATASPVFAQEGGHSGEHGTPITVAPDQIGAGRQTGTVDSTQINALGDSLSDDEHVDVTWPVNSPCPSSQPFGVYPNCKTLCQFNASHPSCAAPPTCPASEPYGTYPNCQTLCEYNPLHSSCSSPPTSCSGTTPYGTFPNCYSTFCGAFPTDPTCTGGGSDYWVRLRVTNPLNGTVNPNTDQLWEGSPEVFVGTSTDGGTVDATSDCQTWGFNSGSGAATVTAVNTGEADGECFVDITFVPPATNPNPVTYVWRKNTNAYGPGSGCHYGEDQEHIDWLISEGVLLTNARPNPARMTCDASTVGGDILLYPTCAATDGVEGESGWECTGSDGSGASYPWDIDELPF